MTWTTPATACPGEEQDAETDCNPWHTIEMISDWAALKVHRQDGLGRSETTTSRYPPPTPTTLTPSRNTSRPHSVAVCCQRKIPSLYTYSNRQLSISTCM